MSNRPPTLTAAAVLETAIGVAVLGFGIFVAYQSAVGEPRDRVTGLAVAALALGFGAGMLRVAKGLLGLERWSRTPAVLTWLFSLPVGVSLIESGQPWWGYPLVVVAACALAALLSGPTNRALFGAEDEDREKA